MSQVLDERPVYDFAAKLAATRGARELTDMETIRAMLDGCIGVKRATTELDKRGVDYVAMLDGGRTLAIDAKCRERGCSRFWKVGPELALERWSVQPVNGNGGKVGWTLDATKRTDLVLFTFDPTDCQEAFLLPFQHLRMAFARNLDTWWAMYWHAPQDSKRWTSDCVFLPVDVVLNAIHDVSCGLNPVA